MDYPKSTPGVGLVDGKFVDENPTLGQIGSLIPAHWGNAVTEEILNVILSAGMTPTEGDLSQLLKAIQTITATDAKRSVRCATTGPIALSGLQNIDGVSVLAGDRVLVKNQANAAQNWIYTAAAGAWVRAQDANESVECIPGHLVPVQSGTANGGTTWQLTNLVPPTLGSTPLNFAPALGRTGVAAGEYTKVKVAADGRVLSASNPDTLAGMGITDALKIGQVGLDATKAPALPDFKAIVPGGFYQANGAGTSAPTPNAPAGTGSVLLGVIASTPRADMTNFIVFEYGHRVWFGEFAKPPGGPESMKWSRALTIADLEAINTALASKAPLDSPSFTGAPKVPTAAAAANDTQIANTAWVKSVINGVIGAAPGALDTLVELANALGNDPNFATTMTNALASKQPMDNTLSALAALSTAANQIIFSTGVDQFAMAPLSALMRGLLGAADSATARGTLGAAAASHTHAMADISGLAAALTAASGMNQGPVDQDPNLAVNQVILTNHANTPDDKHYWHITTTFYGYLAPGANRSQLAIQYDQGNAVYARSCYGEQWNTWTRLDNNTPPGTIVYFASNTPPPGYLKANGAVISRTTYAALFAAIRVFGGAGDGHSTFNVPDLRGEFIRGFDDGRGVDPGRLIASIQASQNANHVHGGTVSAAGGHAHSVSGTATAVANAADLVGVGGFGSIAPGETAASLAGNTAGVTAWRNFTSSGGNHAHPVVGSAAAVGDHVHGVTIHADGGNEARPRNIALLACIKY
ncbi:tail fiber protein [Pseudomonas sp. 2(2015)]|uniref:tail fiber protein n=1 Tax=Pseudomonas sp. 2(2015) TaxID=1619950 RepID=UPI000697302C|nr:tail fiber protein [Pseudomonas sp. 2(2015)]